MDNELVNKINEELGSDSIDQKELDKLKESKILTLKNKPVENGLNEDQNNGLNTILDWLYTYKGSRNENAYFALRGSAGTGKTTLIGALLKDGVIDSKKYWASSICICAPTHKAKKVIGNKTKWPNLETLQSLLGLKLDTNIEDFDPNLPNFAQTGTRKIDDYKLIIIDESSMINTKLYELLCECSRGAMILFVGDHVQLNPVKEYTISLALTNPIHSYTLTQPARQSVNNPLLALLNILREDIEKGTRTYLDILKGMPRNINSEGEGYAVISDRTELEVKLKDIFLAEEFKHNKDHVRCISWTNSSVTRTNRWIRTNVFGYKGTVEKGELLLSYKTVLQGEDLILVNSDDYIVDSIKASIVADYALPLQVEQLSLTNIDNDNKTDIIILEREDINYQSYKSVYDEHLTEAKYKGGAVWSKKFYPFKNHILIMDELAYKNEFEKDEKIKKDLDYGYGITAHKSQGSTYNTVFVSYKDIAQIVTFARAHEVKEAEAMKKRLLYVALSRASKVGYISM